MKRIVIRTYGQSNGLGDSYTGDCDAVCINATPELLERLKRYGELAAKLLEQDSTFLEIAFWDCNFETYSYKLVSDLENIDPELNPYFADFDSAFFDGGFFVLPENFDLSKYEQQRTDCDCLHVNAVAPFSDNPLDHRHFHWSMQPKHTSVTVETHQLQLSELAEILTAAEAQS